MEQIQNDSSHKFKLQEFEGPLDLLLFLIRKSEVNIYDIPIAEIVEQYLAYLEYAAKKNLDNLSEFYIMASTLLYIKSKMLLPVEVNVEDEFEIRGQNLWKAYRVPEIQKNIRPHVCQGKRIRMDY